jgi:hypothetical protein
MNIQTPRSLVFFGPSRRAEAPARARRGENRRATYWMYVSTGSAAAMRPGGMHTAMPATGEKHQTPRAQGATAAPHERIDECGRAVAAQIFDVSARVSERAL